MATIPNKTAVTVLAPAFDNIEARLRALEAAGGGGGGGGSPDASTTVKGVTKLSVAPSVAANPIAVGTNDPRNSDSRTPLAHTHPESDVTGLVADLASKYGSYAQLAKLGVD
jgi:hypothetical protein